MIPTGPNVVVTAGRVAGRGRTGAPFLAGFLRSWVIRNGLPTILAGFAQGDAGDGPRPWFGPQKRIDRRENGWESVPGSCMTRRFGHMRGLWRSVGISVDRRIGPGSGPTGSQSRRMVRAAGLEPAQACAPGSLSPMRLPVSPRPRRDLASCRTRAWQVRSARPGRLS